MDAVRKTFAPVEKGETMDLIDRAALLAEYDRQHEGHPGKARELIANAPAVGIVGELKSVSVVQCKDCRFMKLLGPGYRYCLVWRGVNSLGDDGYCNYGERKDK